MYHFFSATGWLVLGVKLMEINVATAGTSRLTEFLKNVFGQIILTCISSFAHYPDALNVWIYLHFLMTLEISRYFCLCDVYFSWGT